MRVLCAGIVAAFLAAGSGAADQAPSSEDFGVCESTQEFIFREWTWSDGTATTTYTAVGPADEIDQLDPQDPTPVCHDCELASSIQFVPADEAGASSRR